MADLTIPGVTDKYKTQDLVNSLMEVERIPLKREQENVEVLRFEKDSWRKVNQLMNVFRESSRNMFSHDNAFSSKLVSSSAETVLTAVADRDSAEGAYFFTVRQSAKSDRFLSSPVPEDFAVEKGEYAFKIGEKTVKIDWNGGVLSDFIAAANKKFGSAVKMSFVGSSSDEKSLLIEGVATGGKNALVFEGDSLEFAKKIGMLRPKNSLQETEFGKLFRELSSVEGFSSDGAVLSDDGIFVAPKNAVAVSVEKFSGSQGKISFSLTRELEMADDADLQNLTAENGVVGAAETSAEGQGEGQSSFEDEVASAVAKIKDAPIASGIDFSASLEAEESDAGEDFFVFLQKKDGSEVPVKPTAETDGGAQFSFDMGKYPDAARILIKNSSKGENFLAGGFLFSPDFRDGFEPSRAVSRACDAVVEFEGIEMRRPTNSIDDIVPNLTLNVKNSSDSPVEITVGADIESAKNEIFSFVGNYNRMIAEFNILSQRDPDIISDLQYFSEAEAEEAQKRLGLFSGEAFFSREKSYFQQVLSAPYAQAENKVLTLLSQIGISTKSTAGMAASSSQLRGYLEIDEKKLDAALKTHIGEVKNLFAVDTNGDLLPDSGAAVLIEQKLQAYLQTGGILSTKEKNVDAKIKNSESQIARMERQLDSKEQELRRKYGQMSSALRQLEEQSNSISNFSKANSGGNE